jgi:hypothetical protein
VAVPLVLGISTTAFDEDILGAASLTITVGASISGTRTVFGAASLGLDLATSTTGQRTAFGSLAETFTLGITTVWLEVNDVEGAASLTIRFGSSIGQYGAGTTGSIIDVLQGQLTKTTRGALATSRHGGHLSASHDGYLAHDEEGALA